MWNSFLMNKNGAVVLAALLCFAAAFPLRAQVSLSETSSGKNVFPLSTKTCAAIMYDAVSEPSVIGTAVGLLASDIEKVTGRVPSVSGNGSVPASCRYAVIAGTLGHSSLIDALVRDCKIDVSSISGDWERYAVRLVEAPLKGIRRALVVVGSDRRGTAYGLLSLSRAIGVSPWYWWMDAPVEHRNSIYLSVNAYDAATPSVKYRGIFINDEDWGLLRWAKRNFEKELGNIGPKTYEKVCELLLRLNANMLAPAMHEASTAFYQIPQNKEVADRYGIIITASHCEPLLLNTASEWQKDRYGDWNYNTNSERIDSVLNARVVETSPYENAYVIALRGLHDRAMSGGESLDSRKATVQRALLNQRKILSDVLGKDASEIPQFFTPYKEVLDVYNQGLELPDDVTIVWPDDNYGYMKRLSGPKEQLRSGRSGVYYHSSYLGRPHDYLWMNTTSPTLMYEELRKAYDSTADRYWLLNSGDIKSCEFAVDFFLSMAYDIDSFNYERAASYRSEWLCGMLGDKNRDTYRSIFDEFYHQAFIRKPEFMGWGYQWTTDRHGNERNTDTDFSFANYREAERRLEAYRKISSETETLMAQLPSSHIPCFYQSVYYPVKACELMSRMVLSGQKNRWYALQRRSAATAADEAMRCHDSLRVITEGYNSLLDGKWNHVMTMGQGFAASYFKKPVLREVKLSETPELGVMVENEGSLNGVSSYHLLPAFNNYLRCAYFIDIFNRGKGQLSWTAETDKEWILLSRTSGKTADEDRIMVSVDWNNVPVGDKIAGTVTIKDGSGVQENVLVSVFNPSSPTREDLNGIYVQHNGYVSIDAAGYHRKRENDAIKIIDIPNLGIENKAVQFGNPMMPKQNTRKEDVPCVEYDFYTFEQGSVDVYTYVLPTFVLSADRGYSGHEATNVETQYGVCIDDGPVMNPSTSSVEYAQIWYESCLKNCRVNKTTLHINEPGKHSVRILCGDAGTVLQKIVLDFGGLKRSYLGPEPTMVK